MKKICLKDNKEYEDFCMAMECKYNDTGECKHPKAMKVKKE